MSDNDWYLFLCWPDRLVTSSHVRSFTELMLCCTQEGLTRKEINQATIIMRFEDKWAECSGKHLTAAVMNVTRKLSPIALFERIVKLGKETMEDRTCD